MQVQTEALRQEELLMELDAARPQSWHTAALVLFAVYESSRCSCGW